MIYLYRAHEMCHPTQANLLIADLKRAAKLRIVLLLAERRNITAACNLQMSPLGFLQIASSFSFLPWKAK